MARLSQGLITGLAQPSYANALGEGIQGAFSNYAAQRINQEKQKGMEWLTSTAVGADLSNPQVVQGLLTNARANNIDPEQALETITSIQTQRMRQERSQRQEEQAARQAAQHPLQMRNAALAQTIKENQVRAEKISNIVMGKAPQGDKAVNNYIAGLPEEDRGIAQEQYNRFKTQQAEMREIEREENRYKEYSDEEIKAFGLGEDFTKRYRTLAADRPAAANAMLKREKTLQDNLVLTKSRINRAPTKTELEAADALLDEISLPQLESNDSVGREFVNDMFGMSPRLNDTGKANLRHRVVMMTREGKPVNESTITALVKELAGAKATASQPVQEVAQDAAETDTPKKPLPEIGEVRYGYEYIGGNPNKPESWRAVNG